MILKKQMLYYQSPYSYQECLNRTSQKNQEASYQHELVSAEGGGWLLRVWGMNLYAANRSICYWIDFDQFEGYTLIRVERQSSVWEAMAANGDSYSGAKAFRCPGLRLPWSLDRFLKERLSAVPMIEKK
ncbi:MAG: hypothetical protein HFE85_01835 [Clostridiales bacterium]|nr:hypothetical protein [Clostridiales bacterium]